MDAITALNAIMRTNNQLIMAVGLADPSSAIVFDGRVQPTGELSAGRHGGPVSAVVGGTQKNTDGTAEEFMSGFWILEVSSRQEGAELARRAANACCRRVELRAMLG